MELMMEYLPGVKLEMVKETAVKEHNIQLITAETDKRKNIIYINLPYALKDDFKKTGRRMVASRCTHMVGIG
jgi:hypothetical protein